MSPRDKAKRNRVVRKNLKDEVRRLKDSQEE